MELKYRKKNPAWVLMSPRTKYELQAEATDWVYLGGTDKEPAVMVMGIPIRTVDWIPDGIVVVTNHMEYPRPEYPTWFSSTTYKDASKVFDDVEKWWKPLSDYKVTFDESSLTTTTSTGTSTGFSTPSYKWDTATGGWELDTGTTLFPGHATTSGAATPESQSPEEWSDPVEESQEPDPESIYGKALAKVRAESKGKR